MIEDGFSLRRELMDGIFDRATTNVEVHCTSKIDDEWRKWVTSRQMQSSTSDELSESDSDSGETETQSETRMLKLDSYALAKAEANFTAKKHKFPNSRMQSESSESESEPEWIVGKSGKTRKKVFFKKRNASSRTNAWGS